MADILVFDQDGDGYTVECLPLNVVGHGKDKVEAFNTMLKGIDILLSGIANREEAQRNG